MVDLGFGFFWEEGGWRKIYIFQNNIKLVYYKYDIFYIICSIDLRLNSRNNYNLQISNIVNVYSIVSNNLPNKIHIVYNF